MSKVSLLVEVSEEVHAAVSSFLDGHQEWDQDRVMQAGVLLFLLQNRGTDKSVGRLYLDSLFNRPVEGLE
jgi:hypothetical protein